MKIMKIGRIIFLRYRYQVLRIPLSIQKLVKLKECPIVIYFAYFHLLEIFPKFLDSLRATRFGAKPAHQNTFLNYQPDTSSGMYMSPRDQFTRGSNAGLQFLRDHQSLT